MAIPVMFPTKAQVVEVPEGQIAFGELANPIYSDGAGEFFYRRADLLSRL